MQFNFPHQIKSSIIFFVLSIWPIQTFVQYDFQNKNRLQIALPDSLYSEKGNFLIHYTTEGEDAVPLTDENSNGIPDWVEKIAAAFEKSYSVEVGQYLFPAPPNMRDGNPYHIFVKNLNTYFARTIPENFDSTQIVNKNLSSHIIFDNDFSGLNYHISGDSAIKITAAHEFFHAIQMGYAFRQKDGFFLELTAVWMENQVFPDIDNYRYFLDYFFAAPEIPLSGVSYTIPNVVKHIYGRVIWAFFITQRFGKDAIRHIFELMVEKPALEAMDDFFRSKNSSFETEFVNFAVWNYFTGERAIENFGYAEANSFPLIPTKCDTIFEYFAQRSGSGYFLTSNYYLFQSQHEGKLKFSFQTDFPGHWRAAVVVFDDEIISCQILSTGINLLAEKVTPSRSILIIPCNINRSVDPQTIYFKQKPEKYYFSLSLQTEKTYQNIASFKITSATPNPFDREIKFSFIKKNTASIQLDVFNVLGQKIDSQQILSEIESWQWPHSSNNFYLKSGIYLFRFSDGREMQTIKAVHIP